MIADKNEVLIFGLGDSKNLAENISKNLGIELSRLNVKRFSDGEWYLRLLETVRNKKCYIVQSTCTPVNDNLMQLMILVDALKRDSAKSITAIIPYFGYARQDRRNSVREPITAKLVADLLATSGINKAIFMDIHTDQLQGFFSFATDNLSVSTLLIDAYIENHIRLNHKIKANSTDFVLVSPDYGAVKRVRSLADAMKLNLAIVDKKRTEVNEVEIENILGKVKNKNCIVIDDIIDTAGTMVGACKLLKSKGAKSVIVIATHPVLTGKAFERLSEAFDNEWINEMYISNSIELKPKFKKFKQIHVVSLDKYLADIIDADQGCTSSYDEITNRYLNNFLKKLKITNERSKKI